MLRPRIRWRRPAPFPALGRAARTPGQGTTIIVGTSDTLDFLARRYNVSAAAILQANGYKGPRALSPGQQLIIPRPSAAAAAPAPALAPAAPAARPVGRRRRVAVGSCRQSRRYAAQHRPSQPCFGRRTRQSQRPRSIRQAQAWREAHRARRKDRRAGAGCAASRCCRRPARRGAGAARRPGWPL